MRVTGFRLDERGEAGIGSMSLLVSVILVSSIASGTIISSGSLLQNDAEETYSETIEDIVLGLNVISLTGDRGRDSFASSVIDPNIQNIGNGFLYSILTNNKSVKTETWTVTCIKEIPNGGIFAINGTKSGMQKEYNISNERYLSNNDEISFLIIPGELDFVMGDDFEFNTTSSKLYGSMQKLEILVTLRTGSPNINVNQTLIEITNKDEQYILNYSDNNEPLTYSAIAIRDSNGEWDTGRIVGEDSLIKIIIDCSEIGLTLISNNRLEIMIIPESGIPTFESTKIPSVFGGRFVRLY